MKISAYVLIAMFLAIIALTFHVNFLYSGKMETEAPTFTIEEVECRINSDCSVPDGGLLCIDLDDQPVFCGCLDDRDCLGSKCIRHVCS